MSSTRHVTRKRVTAAAAVAALAAGTAVAAATPADAATSAHWAHTATRALHLTNAVRLGNAAGHQSMRLTIGLTPRDAAGIMKLIKEQNTHGSAQYGKYLTPKQFTARFAASEASAAKVADYLRTQGMKHVTVSSNRLQVTATATAAEAEKAFHTSIVRYRRAGATVLANSTAAKVPTSLAHVISGVTGLSTLGMTRLAATPSPSLTGFYPQEFPSIYNALGTSAGTNQSMAVIAEGNLAPTIKDLRTAETARKLRQVPVSLQYAGIKSTDTSGADEWDLDSQTSTAVAPNAKTLYFYVATTLTDSDLARAINLFVSQDKAQAGSASLGECEALPYADGSMTIDDMAFAEAAVQGQTFFASSGDTGSSCAVAPTNGVPASGPPEVNYPASSPYVVAVGGTTLLASTNTANTSGSYIDEASWIAGGGGISTQETSPYWQSGAAPSANSSLPTGGLRGVPDIAFDADETTGANIYVGGTPEEIGGTSLSSPMALGMWTRLQSSHGGKLGFASPKLYAIYDKAQTGTVPTDAAGFHDITVGDNGAYQALPGWDYTTGLGSFNVDVLSQELASTK